MPLLELLALDRSGLPSLLLSFQVVKSDGCVIPCKHEARGVEWNAGHRVGDATEMSSLQDAPGLAFRDERLFDTDRRMHSQYEEQVIRACRSPSVDQTWRKLRA